MPRSPLRKRLRTGCDTPAARATANTDCPVSRMASRIVSASGLVIAQDEATSVIFGMPAEAIKAAAVEHVLGIDDIYAAIEKRVIGICRATPVGAK